MADPIGTQDGQFLGYHAGEGIYFARFDDSGKVHLYFGEGKSLLIDPGNWASIMAHVSKRGETGDVFREALQFHEKPSIGA